MVRSRLVAESLTGVLVIGALLVSGCVDQSEDSGFSSLGPDEDGAGDGDGDGDGNEGPGMELCPVVAPPMSGKVVLGYLPSWGNFEQLIEELDYDTLTHVALAFTNPTDPETGGTWFEYVDPVAVERLVELAHAKDVKVLASIGGAAESDIIRAKIEPETVDEYVEELAAYVERFDLDGVDVDIEGGVVDATYGPLVVKLAQKLRPEGKLLTAAVAQWFQDGIVDEALFCFDFINEMAYDAAGGWSEPGDHASRELVRSRAQYWTEVRDYPAERVVLGLPFYGYCWGVDCDNPGGQISYRVIAERYPNDLDDDWIRLTDLDISINFNSAETIAVKTEFAQDYGGVMIWQMSQDDPSTSLFTAVRENLP